MSSTRCEPGRPPVFALVDYNNFYAACERVFQPQFETEKEAAGLSFGDVAPIQENARTLGE